MVSRRDIEAAVFAAATAEGSAGWVGRVLVAAEAVSAFAPVVGAGVPVVV